MAKELTAFRLPRELLKRLNAQARVEKVNRVEIVIRALDRHLLDREWERTKRN
jgi:hypothetical protein